MTSPSARAARSRVRGFGELQADVPAWDQPLELMCGALGDQLSVVQQGDAVGELIGLLYPPPSSGGDDPAAPPPPAPPREDFGSIDRSNPTKHLSIGGSVWLYSLVRDPHAWIDGRAPWRPARGPPGQGWSRRSTTPLAAVVSTGSSAKLGNTVQVDGAPGTSTW